MKKFVFIFIILFIGVIPAFVGSNGVPQISVSWNTPSYLECGEPAGVSVTVCNYGGDATLRCGHNTFGGDYLGSCEYSIASGQCITMGWAPGTGPTVSERHIDNGYVEYYVEFEMVNSSGSDYWEGSKYIPVECEVDDPCEGIQCESECYGCDLWATKCVDGECVKDYIIEEDSSICCDISPCENVRCYPECYGCEYWAMKCVDGDCVKDYIIERNSKECGCRDPCENVRCYPECYGCEYWATKCVDGECVKDYIIERNSKECGCGDPCENVNCPDECHMCHLWAMKCVNGKCEKDKIIEMESKKCGCPEDPCNNVGEKSVDNMYINTIIDYAIGKLIDCPLAGTAVGVYLSVIKLQGGMPKMDIVLLNGHQSTGSRNIMVTPGKTIEFYLRFVPSPGTQTLAELSVEYLYPSSRESRTIASWEFRNSNYEGYFIGTGCTEYEIHSKDGSTPIAITFKDQGEYFINAKIQGASDTLQVSVYTEDEDEKGECIGTILIFLFAIFYVFLSILKKKKF